MSEQVEEYYPKMYVLIKGERVYNDDPDINVIDVEEDIQGRDVLTVEYRGAEYRRRPFAG